MKLSSSDLRNLEQQAVRVAQQAAELIQHYAQKTEFKNQISSSDKLVGNTRASQLLTKADIESDTLIRQGLSESCQQYDLAMLTEESLDDHQRFTKDYFWCVDPLDGTLPFVEGRNGYAVSIALVSKAGAPVIGVVCDVSTSTIYSAIIGKGAYRNKQTIVLPALPEVNPKQESLKVSCDASFAESSNYSVLVSGLTALAKRYGYMGLRICEAEGAVMNACNLLVSTPGVYLKVPKREQGGGSVWDFAATAAIFNELAAVACNAYGGQLNLNPSDTLFMNEGGVIFSSDIRLGKELQEIITLGMR